MSEPRRPRWADRLRFFVTNDMTDPLLHLPDRLADPLFDLQDRLIERPVLAALCWRFGHLPQPDQCLIPAHDFCVYCNKSMPGAAKRATTVSTD